jgi:hypothetical protein
MQTPPVGIERKRVEQQHGGGQLQRQPPRAQIDAAVADRERCHHVDDIRRRLALSGRIDCDPALPVVFLHVDIRIGDLSAGGDMLRRHQQRQRTVRLQQAQRSDRLLHTA